MRKSLTTIAVLLTAAVAWAQGPTVTVTGGTIEGAIEDGVKVFKGIPYAAPPVRELRWRPPAPVEPWAGVRAATAFSPDCPQAKYSEDSLYYRPPRPQDEDCLCLNVWTAAEPGDDRPVMVWIHGGALTRGSGAVPTYDGTSMAQKGVVLVTINYRLGALGFMAHPDLTAESEHGSSGNYGFLDQIAALRWVQENIEKFGGDPDRVTIFGESAGSWSVCALQATPLSKGLFHRAIGQSGGLFGPMRYLSDAKHGQKAAEQVGLRFADALGAEDAAGLRAMPADRIVSVFFDPPDQQSFSIGGNVDGWVFPDEIRSIFAVGRQHDVPVIVGSNADEMTSLTSRGRIPGTIEQLKEYVDRQYALLSEDFFEVYPADTDEDAAGTFLASARDRAFSWQMRTWARRMENVDSEAYLYFFTRVPPIENSEYYQAFHAAEIAYVFGNLNPDVEYTAVDRRLSNAMTQYWINFATSGNPNGEDLETWPAYNTVTEPYLILGDEIETDNHLLRDQLDFIERAMVERVEGNTD